MFHADNEDLLPDEPIGMTEAQADEMIDWYMSQPKTEDALFWEKNTEERWFPKPENKSVCNGKCIGCAPTSCPAFN